MQKYIDFLKERIGKEKILKIAFISGIAGMIMILVSDFFPTVAAADFEVPVGQPKVDGVFAWDGVTVTVKGIVESRAHAARQVAMITGDDRIVDRLGVGGNFCCMRTVFGRVNKVEVVCACGLPANVAIVAIKTIGKGCSNT